MKGSTMTTFLASCLFSVLIMTKAVNTQWAPSCSYNDCMQGWDGSSCTSNSGWDCICSNATAVAQINTCVATSCTNVTDQEAIYGAIAQLCANNGVTVTNSQQATFSATSGGSLLATITGGPGYYGGGGWGPGGRWNSGAWSSWVSACSTAVGSAPSGWNGNGAWGNGWGNGWGGHGGGGAWSSGAGGPWGGPWGTKASGIACGNGNGAWTTWTAGWGPYSSWTGTWSGCSTTTASPSPATVTTTVTTNGQTSVITGTTFGIQAAAVSASSGGSGSSSSTNAASSSFSDIKAVSFFGCVAATAVFAVMIVL